jgi:hypothetical protein
MPRELATWQTTVTDLIGVLQSSFRALIPSLERAKIPWREGEAYDDWDAIASVLFEQFVLRAIRWSLPPEDAERLQVPRYDMLYPDYSEMSFLARKVESGSPPFDVFHSLATTTEPFDTVRFIRLDGQSRQLTGTLRSAPFEDTL